MMGQSSIEAHLRLSLSAIFGILFVSLSSSDRAFAQVAPEYETRLEWKACWFKGESDWPAMHCGVLEVPENRDKPEGKKVRLPFVLFKAFTPVAGKLPVLVTGGGGPGNPVGIPTDGSDKIDESVWYNTSAMSVYDGRALIVMDNRGVGSAQPRLACPEIAALELRELMAPSPSAEAVAASARAYESCRVRLSEEGVDINAYNSVTAAQDIEDLRIAFGLPKLNLFGVSFGTRIALTYLRDFPQSVNAMVLDGVVGPEVKFFEVSPRRDHETLKRIFELCRQDAGCRKRYGADLYDRFVQFLKKLEQAPVTLRVTDPSSMMPLEIVMTPEVLVFAIFSAIYDETKIAQIPRAIAAMVNGSMDYISALVRDETVSAITVDDHDDGAYAAYQCHGVVPYNDLGLAMAEAAKYPAQGYMNEAWIRYEQAMCNAWRMIDGGPIEAEAVASDRPVLLYSGEFDPVTPHSDALSAAKTLANATLKEWPGIGHNVLAKSYCADQIAGAFFDDPYGNPLSHDCLDEELPPTLEFD